MKKKIYLTGEIESDRLPIPPVSFNITRGTEDSHSPYGCSFMKLKKVSYENMYIIPSYEKGKDVDEYENSKKVFLEDKNIWDAFELILEAKKNKRLIEYKYKIIAKISTDFLFNIECNKVVDKDFKIINGDDNGDGGREVIANVRPYRESTDGKMPQEYHYPWAYSLS